MLDVLYPADRYLNFFSVAKSSTPRQRCVKSQLASLHQLGFLVTYVLFEKFLYVFTVSVQETIRFTYILPGSCPFRKTRQANTTMLSLLWLMTAVSSDNSSARIISLSLTAPSLHWIIHEWLFKARIG